MPYAKTVITKLRQLWLHYLLQSALAAAVLYALFLLFGPDRIVLITAMGSTAFVVFALPTTGSAQTHVVVASHFVGLLSGALFSFQPIPLEIGCPLAVGLAIFLMVTFDVEHAPAAGSAIAVVIHEVSYDIFIAVMFCAVAMSLCKYLLRHQLRNLI
jgi:CBS-domain-containing membrane protein